MPAIGAYMTLLALSAGLCMPLPQLQPLLMRTSKTTHQGLKSIAFPSPISPPSCHRLPPSLKPLAMLLMRLGYPDAPMPWVWCQHQVSQPVV